MSDWRNFEHYKCRDCGATREQWAPNSYDGDDSKPYIIPEWCEECFEVRHKADIAEEEREGIA